MLLNCFVIIKADLNAEQLRGLLLQTVPGARLDLSAPALSLHGLPSHRPPLLPLLLRHQYPPPYP